MWGACDDQKHFKMIDRLMLLANKGQFVLSITNTICTVHNFYGFRVLAA